MTIIWKQNNKYLLKQTKHILRIGYQLIPLTLINQYTKPPYSILLKQKNLLSGTVDW